MRFEKSPLVQWSLQYIFLRVISIGPQMDIYRVRVISKSIFNLRGNSKPFCIFQEKIGRDPSGLKFLLIFQGSAIGVNISINTIYVLIFIKSCGIWVFFFLRFSWHKLLWTSKRLVIINPPSNRIQIFVNDSIFTIDNFIISYITMFGIYVIIIVSIQIWTKFLGSTSITIKTSIVVGVTCLAINTFSLLLVQIVMILGI